MLQVKLEEGFFWVVIRINVVDLENYLRIGDWMDYLLPVIAMSTLFAEELSVCGPRNNDSVSCTFLKCI